MQTQTLPEKWVNLGMGFDTVDDAFGQDALQSWQQHPERKQCSALV